MKKGLLMWAIIAAAGSMATTGVAKTGPLSDAQIKQAIIAESIASYPRSCACPYNRARNGSACGKRSAWSRAGGYAPICYADEITKQDIEQWRDNHR
ncbi:hypothetical protein [Enterobacter sp. Bisph1]|uniref:hypothetical protein n=1 Tax=Enterobacter sp. Bisph1 TaxID=1274399 RepID=UPI00057BF505|nr:hypothetical protein [Enterobacter sp. Bisph1]